MEDRDQTMDGEKKDLYPPNARSKLLLIDACGVLFGEPMGPLFSAIAESSPLSANDVSTLFKGRFRDDLWSGRLDEERFWADFARGCGVDRSKRSWRSVVLAAMSPLPAADLIAGWSRMARLVLLSNLRHEWLMPRLAACGMTPYFDEVRVSSVTGEVKPDLVTYRNALGALSPADVLYVDDKPANISAAGALDIPGLCALPDGMWTVEVEQWLAS